MRITGKNEWGHRDLNPDPRISLVSVLQLVIILSFRVRTFFKDNWSPR